MSSEATPKKIAEIQGELDPRILSRKIDKVGRAEIASKIHQRRLDQRRLDQQIDKIKNLLVTFEQLKKQKETTLAAISEKLDVRLRKLFGFEDSRVLKLQAEIAVIETDKSRLQQQALILNQKSKGPPETLANRPDPKNLLDAYYKEIANTPLSNEQKRELLKPEVLSSLSTEQYIALWKRLNPHFLSHVTRQGFRDHNVMMAHSAGMQEFHNGFIGVMSDSRLLRPPMALRELKNREENSVRAWMKDPVLSAATKEEAEEKLNTLVNFHLAAAPKYPDKTAVHFATQLVADDYYGGEKDNEVFFIYPSDVIASQYDFAFNGWEKDFTEPQSERKWNDVFVWPQTVENSGIPIDAGIVFLPKNTLVDSETGSKYASKIEMVEGEEKRVLVEDSELVNRFVTWVTTIDESSPIREVYNSSKVASTEYGKQYYQDRVRELIKTELVNLGFSQDAIQGLAKELFKEMSWHNTFSAILSMQMLSKTGAQYKRAEHIMRAEDYWEKQFTQNPNLRPKHVVYYEGDPSQAVFKFQRTHGIGSASTSATEGVLLGFGDRHVEDMNTDTRSNQGKKELMQLAKSIINQHYQGNVTESSNELDRNHQ